MIGGVAQPKIQMTDSRAAAAAIHVAVTTSQNSLNSTNNSSLRTSNSNVSKSKQSLENLSHLRNTPQFQQHHVNSSLDSLNSSSLPTERNSDSSNNTYSRRRTFTSDTFLSVVSKTSDTGGGSGNSCKYHIKLKLLILN